MLTPQSSPTQLSTPKKQVMAMWACAVFDTLEDFHDGSLPLAPKEAPAATTRTGRREVSNESSSAKVRNEGPKPCSANTRLIIPNESEEVNWVLNIFDPSITSMNGAHTNRGNDN